MSSTNTDPVVTAQLAALTTRVTALEVKVGIAAQPTPPTFVESPAGTTVTTVFGTLSSAVAAGAVIVGANGGTWRLVTSLTQGNQIEYTPLGGNAQPPTGAKVSTLYKATDRRIYQGAQTPVLWWNTDDVWPPTWTLAGTTALPPGYVPPVVVPPDVPVPPVVPPGFVAGRRIAELLRAYGANTYANGQDSAGSDASAARYLVALQYLGFDSAADFTMREYTNNAAQQEAFCDAIFAAMPNVGWNFCLTFPGSPDILANIVNYTRSKGKTWLKFLEGINEANQTAGFTWGATSPAQCLALQQGLYALGQTAGLPVMPACVAITGADFGPTWIQDYYGGVLPQINALCDLGNSHDYPNSGSPGTELRVRTSGVWNTFNKQTGMITEASPKLYNIPTDENTAAYYELLMLINGHYNMGLVGMQHWPLYDYPGYPPYDGLFIGHDPTKPRPMATAIRALNRLCADRSNNRFTFDPGNLDIQVTGLPRGKNTDCGGHFAVYRGSDGDWRVFIWDEQDSRGNTTTPVTPITVAFGSQKSRVLDYSLTGWAPAGQTDNPPVLQSIAGTSGLKMNLRREIRLLRVTP